MMIFKIDSHPFLEWTEWLSEGLHNSHQLHLEMTGEEIDFYPLELHI